MDLSTPIGLISGIVLIAWAIMSGGDLATFIDIPSVIIVVGGTIAAMMINFPFGKLMNLFRVIPKAFANTNAEPMAIIDQLVEFSEKARREGILSLESILPNIQDPFLRSGLQLTIDGTDADTLKGILYAEVSQLENRHGDGQKTVKAISTLAPAFGMIGTLVGLVLMLKTLDDPTKIGAGMAVALITTFYGAMISNLITIPLEGKLKTKTTDEVRIREMIIEGLLSIQSGENPRLIRSRLQAILPPSSRKPVH
ncbi:MAG: motility protein A [Fibrobacteres bacterium]|nr:motility protein A [Fibrobacterota bacterium]